MDCKIQSVKLKPPNQPDASFPSLQINIGYAYNGTPAHKHLIVKKCTNVIPIDFSFNEITKKVETINITDEEQIQVYSLSDLIAEKYRAVLQQEVRNRIRRQDVFDLYFIMKDRHLSSNLKKDIYESLIEKSLSRNLIVNQFSMDNPNIKERCKQDYHVIQDEIDFELPDFELTYLFVNESYKSLPWI